MSNSPFKPPGATALELLAHELRTPLNGIIGYADAMNRQTFGPLPAPYVEHAEIVLTSARHLLSLVDVLASAGEDGLLPGSVERFDPSRLVHDVVQWFVPTASASGVSLRIGLKTGEDTIAANRRALTQILVNLLDNALKNTAEGGSVEVETNRIAGVFKLVVVDSGGRASTPGRGLGLHIVRTLCAFHGGEFSIAKSVEAGMTATVSFPRFDEV